MPGPKLVEGRPRVPDRQALCGILFVLHTGIQWEYLPQELGFGSGMTCWRRLAAWNEAGVWDELNLRPAAEVGAFVGGQVVQDDVDTSPFARCLADTPCTCAR